ncbi:MAG: PH domain-containing protein [Deltaproteobacteria bacterium]|nr:PH domain-containing protein [Deltaproteobacteria bacterium]
MNSQRIVVHKVWRSEIERIVVLFVLCIAAVALSHHFPSSTIRGELFTLGETRIDLNLPLFALMPVVALGDLLARIYDVLYVLDGQGIEAREGIISLNQRIITLRYEDVRMVEFDQSLIERFLDVGTLQVGTAASSEVELEMKGVAAPREIQQMIQSERDKRRITDPKPETDLARAQA